ncbi:hypothetical protein NDN08_000751 [Rhodosorus marinus]|uniref:Peroxin-7 n=1 Tax=Rhodosorus marinus TaxID=101924 RepID=A0AAV8UUJ3_9RHOD|nr:hypothetical protein NDN08_000751 [Rhodosorus marinus]
MLAGADGPIAECRVPLPCSSIQTWAGSSSSFGIVALSGSEASSRRSPRGHVTLVDVKGLALNVRSCKLTNARVLDGCLFVVDYRLYLAAADAQGYLTVWNYLAFDSPLRAWQAHTGSAERVIRRPRTPFQCLSCGGDGKARLWDVPRVTEIQAFGIGRDHRRVVTDMACSPAGDAFGATSGEECYLLDIRSNRTLSTIGIRSEACSCAWSEDGSTIAVGGADGVLALFDVRMSGNPFTAVQTFTGRIRRVRWHRDNLLTCGQDAPAGIWRRASQLGNRFVRTKLLDSHQGCLSDVDSFSTDNIVTCGLDRSMKLWSYPAARM